MTKKQNYLIKNRLFVDLQRFRCHKLLFFDFFKFINSLKVLYLFHFQKNKLKIIPK
jgi:hypothetical protein